MPNSVYNVFQSYIRCIPPFGPIIDDLERAMVFSSQIRSWELTNLRITQKTWWTRQGLKETSLVTMERWPPQQHSTKWELKNSWLKKTPDTDKMQLCHTNALDLNSSVNFFCMWIKCDRMTIKLSLFSIHCTCTVYFNKSLLNILNLFLTYM